MTQTQDSTAMSGLEQIQAMAAGLVQVPIAELVGMDSFEVIEEGRVATTLTPGRRHYNPLGTVHGGIISTLLDTAAACSVHTTLAPGEGYTSLDLTVKFLRAVTEESGPLRAEGRVIQRGRRTALAEAQLVDGAGRLVAHATSSCMVFPAT